MAISTIKISDTAEWAKRLNFERRSAISGSLEPALTSANMVMQTILSPPFDWWWNTQELALTCNPVLGTASITNIAITSNVVTITAANSFAAGQTVIPSGLTAFPQLNGVALVNLAVSPTQITATVSLPNFGSVAETGTLTAVTTQDYSLAIPGFSHIEHASVYDITGNTPKWYELSVKNNLSADSTVARPRWINPYAEDANGNVTFRVMPAPDQKYPINLQIQKSAPLITSFNQTWAPIPDYMEYVYNWGFLTFMYMFSDDTRFAYASQKFLAALLSRAQGLTEEERNVFLNNWNNLTSSQQMQTQQGIASRQV